MIKRTHIAALSLSAAALVGIATHEGYRDNAYIPVPGDRPTIGFGHAGPTVKPGDKTTPTRALVTLLADANDAQQAVKRCADVPLHQHEFDAYVSLTYNIGGTAFCRSTIVRRLKAGDYAGACDAILMWDKFQGRPLAGLTKRRQDEHRQCVKGQHDPIHPPADQTCRARRRHHRCRILRLDRARLEGRCRPARCRARGYCAPSAGGRDLRRSTHHCQRRNRAAAPAGRQRPA